MSDEQTVAAEESVSHTEKITTRAARRATSSNGSGAKPRTINFVLQGKGGCGKTLVASLIAQSLRERAEPVACIDTDPVNASFVAIASLKAERVRLMRGNKVDVDTMNAWAERAFSEDNSFVVDSGAASYLPLTEYLVGAQILDFLAESGKSVLVHMPVIGGRNLAHTVNAVDVAVKTLPANVGIVPWFNPYFGEIVAPDGADLESTVVYSDMAERLTGPVKLPDLNPEYDGASFAAMLDANRTFAEERSTVGLIQRMWLDRTWKAINDQIVEVV